MNTNIFNWCDLGTDGSIPRLCKSIKKVNIQDEEWNEAIRKVMLGNDVPYLRLTSYVKREE